MTELTQESLLALMLVFCRVGGCFLLIPGIASERVPAQVRFFLAFAISAAIGPLVMDDLREAAVTDAARFLPFVISETATGLLLGLRTMRDMARPLRTRLKVRSLPRPFPR